TLLVGIGLIGLAKLRGPGPAPDPGAPGGGVESGGETVTDLIPPEGVPKGLTWRLGGATGTAREWPADKAFPLDTQRQAVAELLPPADRPGGVRATARVRMNDRRRGVSRVGIY